MGTNFTRRNHHIPQRYQLGFADPNEKVHIFDRKRSAYVYGKPKNIGFENDFYTTVTPSGERSDAVEKLLAQVEGKSWPLLDKLASGESLSERERSTVSFFAALMRTRTTSFDSFSKSYTDVVAKSLLHLFNPDKEALQRNYEEATGKTLTADEAHEMLRALQEHGFDVVPHRQTVIRSMLDIATELERELFHMEWEVYSAPADCRFVTSDNPFVTVPPQELDLSIQGYGPLTPGAMNIIPIDKSNALFMKSGARREITFRKANRDLIREVNIMVGSASDRLIIASNAPQLRKVVARCQADKWVNTFETAVLSPPDLAARFNTKDQD